ncbi:MAG TPA: hypothetical protein VIZ17_23110, partial [Acetobacteraceae bacterium]
MHRTCHTARVLHERTSRLLLAPALALLVLGSGCSTHKEVTMTPPVPAPQITPTKPPKPAIDR